jgi:alkylhydroperoxidase family enzyme
MKPRLNPYQVAPDTINALRALVGRQFSEQETVNLTMLVSTINAWNRIAISFRAMPPVIAKAAA